MLSLTQKLGLEFDLGRVLQKMLFIVIVSGVRGAGERPTPSCAFVGISGSVADRPLFWLTIKDATGA